MALEQILQYISDGLSVVTIALCIVLKIPQIKKLLDSQSTVGMSVTGLILELISYSISTSYNFVNGYSLLTYLEYPIIIIQEYILIFLVLKYQNLINTRTSLVVLIYFIVCAGFVTETIPKIILTLLLPFPTPISASSKIVQLITILKAKNADSVSPLTWFISTITNSTRIFTIWIDSADIILLSNFIISTFLSLSIMCATLYYRKGHKKVE
ncbi:solute carrier family 66 member 3 [Phymastichus coffea]|uniref:solute carrier family 66 member 3 n=1 Tax=Phymastichus coffea TaxID=108790 RepID=UPI00273C62E1|nr:solute carrier family 66 member 3 [Phymastichus coffea]